MSSSEAGIIASPFDVKLLDTKNNVLMIRLFIQQMPLRDKNTEFDLRVVLQDRPVSQKIHKASLFEEHECGQQMSG